MRDEFYLGKERLEIDIEIGRLRRAAEDEINKIESDWTKEKNEILEREMPAQNKTKLLVDKQLKKDKKVKKTKEDLKERIKELTSQTATKTTEIVKPNNAEKAEKDINDDALLSEELGRIMKTGKELGWTPKMK